jgi:tRNA (guanine-N7-)-methyltransferase
MPGPGKIEREFGVPFPGAVLPPQRWTRTALKRLPHGKLDLVQLFGRRAPLVLDLGCGNGRFLIASALARPDHDHLGIDVLPVVIRYATRRANQRGLGNIRFAVRDAQTFLACNLPPHSAKEIHIYHPQPYYDPGQVGRRLIQPAFVAQLHQALVARGELFIQTDNPGYWRYLIAILPCFFDFQQLAAPWPDAPRGRTRREIIARRQGLQIFRGHGRAKTTLDEEEASRLAAALPPPQFDADRRLQELDRWE